MKYLSNMAALWTVLNCSKMSLLSCPLTASKVSYLRPLSILLSICERNVHHSAPVEGKYHCLERKRRRHSYVASQLKAKLWRLDPKDRPTGCLLCPMRNDVEINYKNVRLLSQFVSPHTGRIYGRQLTGLCNKKQKELASAIRRARAMGFMPVTMKYLDFHTDPKLF